MVINIYNSLYCRFSVISVLFIIAAAFTLTFPLSALADITRGCKGAFSVNLYDIKGVATNSTTKVIDNFEGRGACKNKTQANKCRERAKDNIFRCANELWNMRWNLIGDPNDSNADLSPPSICQGRSTGAKGVGPYHENSFGQFFDIKHQIEHQACCVMQTKADSMKVKLTVHSSGDKGCGKHQDWAYQPWGETRPLIDDYYVDCKTLRVKQRICGGKRTGG